MKSGLTLQQTLEHKVNQALIQSIQMLQFTSMELHDYIKEMAMENPLIEEVVFDADIDDYTYQPSQEPVSIDINAAEKNLYEQLKEQLFTLKIPEELRTVVEYGIDSLDERGYLDISLEEWAENCQTDTETTELALNYIQQLEPHGIGARDLGECLLLQVRHMDGYEAYMDELILENLNWIAELNYEAIIETYEIDEDEIMELLKMIQACDPNPGELLDTPDAEYVVPEATVYKEEGVWKVNFFNWSAPKIILNDSYNDVQDKEAKKFLNEKLQEVEWLKRSIQYRSSTIEQIINKVVEKQVGFFESGVLEMRAFTLTEMAAELELHVSTISRAISKKYIQTPHGMFELKFFFQSGVKQKNGQVAAIVIKKRIIDLIEKEDKSMPLSDQKIKEKLKDEYSLEIARRTVVKYREQLGIPSSYKRRVK